MAIKFRALELRLPWPPSVNRIWRAFNGRIILSTAARAYIVQASNALPTGRAVPLTGRLAVWLYMCPPLKTKTRWDIANREKILCDTLTKNRVWLDDEQIDALSILRGEPSGKGYVDILIQEY